MLTAVFALGCNKKFDEPPTGDNTDPDITATTTIAELKNAYALQSGQAVQITGGKIIKGVVVGNDRSGNIYKTLYIDDGTAGLPISLNTTGLYNTYPVGREIFIRTDSLWLWNTNSMITMGVRTMVNGAPVYGGIPPAFIDKYIVRGKTNRTVPIQDVTNISQLNNTYQGRLIRLQDMEVATGDLNKTFADTSANKGDININFQNCDKQAIIARSSGYANFAGVKVPSGRGEMMAIYTVYNATKQLVIRDTSDLKFTQPRCGAVNPADFKFVTIGQLRTMFNNGQTDIPDSTAFRGVIVSSTTNEAAGNYRIQDATAGVQIRFAVGANPNAVLGDSMIVNVSKLKLELFPAGNGDLQINNVTSATMLGTGSITPRIATVAEINANVNNWASTVVKINNVTIAVGTSSGTGTNYTITDATGSIQTFVRTTSGITMPPAASSITGYVSIFSGTPQLTLRVQGDVVASTSPTPIVSTTAISGISQTGATSGGNVTSEGTSAVTARGVVWSTSQNPDISLSTKTNDGAGPGTFTSVITGLTAGVTYYVRAYATNASGTSYGNQVSFTTGTTSGTVTTEDFETGSKSSYAAASVTLTSGSWMFSDAVIGITAGSDIFNGAKSARIRGTVGSNNGYIETEFAIPALKKVTVQHAQTNFNEGTGAVTPSIELWISKNGGAFTKVGTTATSVKGTFTTTTWDVNAVAGENVKVRILNTSSVTGTTGATYQVRVNVDDVKFDY